MAIPGKENENGVYEFPYMVKPPHKTKWEAIKTGIWDPSTKEFLGRTAKSWLQILLFYAIFYAALAALFAICMAALYSTLDKDRPSYTDDRSLIGSNPGLGFRPIASSETSEGALIYYNLTNNATQQKYIKLIDEFLKEYDVDHPGPNSKYSHCNFTDMPVDGKACLVDITEFKKCNGPTYGYDTASPCVFLKLNKIYDWVPKTYNTSEKLPKEMPKKYKDKVKTEIDQGWGDQVWISCDGEYAADKEHVLDFDYFPYKGLPSFYYPYQHKKDAYLSPLIAVQILNPKPGVIINIECRAWAENIEYMGGQPEQRKGSVHFEVMIDH